MPNKITLNGITWGHSRGITPLLAASQRFNELHPHIEINWKKRTLQEFADFPIEKLTEQYDLLIIDHPWVGCAAATECVLPLEQYLSKKYLDNQKQNSVGYSHLSYNYKDHQWALAIDAAAPFASYRKDLMEKVKVAVPQTWEEVIALAKEGKVAVPAIPIDLLMNFYSFCIAAGNEPFANSAEVINEATGIEALQTMNSLWSLVDKSMFTKNPIAVAEIMSSTNDYWYCPFAYGYTNYSRVGYAKHLLHYTDVISINGSKLLTTIGGTGLSVSAFSKNKQEAVSFAEMVCSENCQSTLYVQHGGQPGHLSAWKDTMANVLTNNFFNSNLPAMERGYVRPRYNGYLYFQDHGGDFIHDFLSGKNKDAKEILKGLNKLYKHSLEKNKTLVTA
jgi:multiple sugar transport system substrate-binding protein